MKEYDIVLVSYYTSSRMEKAFSEDLKNINMKETIFQIDLEVVSLMCHRFLESLQFHRIILDEAQAIKNKQALASKAMTYLRAQYRFCLTGTPMQNGIEELYPLLRF